ncbi:hypothetical protein ACQB6R_04920 [Propionibacteriaceae bacterium G1746]|uniref:hypothetical protein n=1 Tax=Aestuariimicrobium sp. G57 TaxID=3418485 RepID=UPI003C29EAEA
MTRSFHYLTGLLISLILMPAPRRHRDRGLSQSTENAILLAGAVAVAGIVIAVVTAYVQSKLPR